MMERISQSVAGRVSLFTLLPFSLAELQGQSLGSLDEVLVRGLYPRLYSAEIGPFRFYQSHNTVRAWISVLETSYVVRLLRPHHRNFGKQTVKSPRLYSVDTGLVCALLEIDSPLSLTNHYLRRAIFENLVVNEMAKAFVNAGKLESISLWRDRRGHEIDVLVDRPQSRVAIEAKAGMTATGAWFRGLSYYGELDPDCPAGNRYVVYGGDEGQKRSVGEIMPWRELPALAARVVEST